MPSSSERRSDDDARAIHAADQQLAQQRHAAAEIATMYKTLFAEIGDRDVAQALTIAWINAIAYTGTLIRRSSTEETDQS